MDHPFATRAIQLLRAGASKLGPSLIAAVIAALYARLISDTSAMDEIAGAFVLAYIGVLAVRWAFRTWMRRGGVAEPKWRDPGTL